MAEPQKIALFGGTFDPVHLGHVHLAEAARNALSLDQVRFIPCRISPHKLATRPTHPEERLEMLRLATADLPWAAVDPLELEREGTSFSYQTAEAIKEAFPQARLFWIMGADQWNALPDWAKPERLAACVEFIVFPRGIAPEPRKGFTMHTVEARHPASATAIRHTLATGGTTSWLHPDVARWIRSHGLYKGEV